MCIERELLNDNTFSIKIIQSSNLSMWRSGEKELRERSNCILIQSSIDLSYITLTHIGLEWR